jgi:putative addiction module component (TIGR02574 family)
VASPFESVAEQALSLNPRERLRLATELLQSVEPRASDEVENAWEEEIQRRIAEIDSGAAKGRPWDEIKRDFNSRYGPGR